MTSVKYSPRAVSCPLTTPCLATNLAHANMTITEEGTATFPNGGSFTSGTRNMFIYEATTGLDPGIPFEGGAAPDGAIPRAPDRVSGWRKMSIGSGIRRGQ